MRCSPTGEPSASRFVSLFATHFSRYCLPFCTLRLHQRLILSPRTSIISHISIGILLWPPPPSKISSNNPFSLRIVTRQSTLVPFVERCQVISANAEYVWCLWCFFNDHCAQSAHSSFSTCPSAHDIQCLVFYLSLVYYLVLTHLIYADIIRILICTALDSSLFSFSLWLVYDWIYSFRVLV